MRTGALATAATAALCLAALAVPASPARAAGGECAPPEPSFGLCEMELSFTDSGGAPSMQAGSHPFAVNAANGILTAEPEAGKRVPVEEAKDVSVSLPPGLVGDPTAVPRCSAAQFTTPHASGLGNECPNSSAVGIAQIEYGQGSEANNLESFPLYNLEPSPGSIEKLGFLAEGRVPVVIEVALSQSPPYNPIARATNISQVFLYFASKITVWGVPASPAHDPLRGNCLKSGGGSRGSCPAEGIPEVPFLTMPTRCEGPLEATFEADSWLDPTPPPYPFSETVETQTEQGAPLGTSGCSKLGFEPTLEAKPTTRAAQSPSGLDLSLNVADPGLLNPSEEATAQSEIREARIALPVGMTANPSIAEGLGVCTEAQLARESASSAPGAGCPEASKIGSVEVQTPLLEETVTGAVYLAAPYENKFKSLLALYIVLKNPKLGISVVQAVEIAPDQANGRLIARAEEIPQLPFSRFTMRLREGARSPLISPPGCGSFETEAELLPWSGGEPIPATSPFQIISGPNEGPCPAAPPFNPGFEAGSLSAAAAHYSPFYMRLTRRDAEQDMTRFSAVLPPGVLGKIAGLGRCTDAQIAQAASRTGPHGGREELEHPSCPATSAIGRTSAAAGVGSQLTYVPGSLYLAGPFHGDPLSVVAIVPALAGPFDAGTVVVREALTLNPVTAEVEVDGAASDPIPHILKGIPLNVREIEVYADKPEFTLNPTSCAPFATRATLWGGGTSLHPSGEVPAGLSAPYRAVNCAKLGFKPKLAIKLEGGTKRGKFPALKAVVTPRPEDANFSRAVVTLPRSAFLEQAHIKTICTRVQYAAAGGNGASCPPASVYGKAKAWSPLLEGPAEGPVYLRSSNHNLPDLVVALKGPPSAPFDVTLSARIDSKNGGIRSSFEAVPDVPVSRFVLEMQGGKKGLIVNSANICHATHRAEAKLSGQNGRLDDFEPAVGAAGCPKGKGKKQTPRHKRRAPVDARSSGR
jgi:hypothetical protein